MTAYCWVTELANRWQLRRDAPKFASQLTDAETKNTVLLAPNAAEFPQKKKGRLQMVSNRINPRMGVIFDEIEIEEVIAPRF